MMKIFMKALVGSTAFALSLSLSSAAFAEYKGFGDNIPLQSAARQIVPSDYSIKYGSNVDKSTPLSWKAAKDWKSALSSAAAQKGLTVSIEGSNVVINEKKAPEVQVKASSERRPYASTPSASMVQKKSHSAHSSKPRVTSAPVQEANVGGGGFMIRPYHGGPAANSSAKPNSSNEKLVGKEIKEQKGDGWTPVNKGDGQYVVAPGYMLRTTLSKWAEAAGWHLVWNSEFDYAITTGATFSGDFVSASKQLLTAMKDARPTITADFFNGNKTVVIANKMADEVN